MPDSFEIKERQFESDIEAGMAEHGWQTIDSKTFNESFDRITALNPSVFIEFIKNSQPAEWKKYQRIIGPDAEQSLITRLDTVIRKEGLLRVIRNGFKDRGVKFRAMFPMPETEMNNTAVKQYQDNIFQVVRQLHYSPKNENSIDIVLFVNGIPVISMELKCQFNGQDKDNAISQYKFDRNGKEKIFAFKERVLAHFAVDLSNVYMTTRLQSYDTFFLPFNQGSNGAGAVGGKGNPVNPDGYAVSYLWEKVFTPEGLSEILFKYLHLEEERDETGAVKAEKMIFPRYHQLDVVSKILADVKANGSGKNYLVEHSAGSGKSNSIAWLAHRLSSLHDNNDKKIFQSVIIVTDRKVLDSQLQNTVFQFDHQPGVVEKIDKDSKQLKKAIEDGKGIIITTLQKFPVIYKELNTGSKNFAVIVDEAHSSQTGNAAKKLKYALADTEEVLKQMAEEAQEEEASAIDPEDQLLLELSAQGQQENLSFFAFTATPKDKTLQMFGEKKQDGSYRPYHVYSMRQAIEEGFIMDVLQNYMTYNMYYQIVKTIEDDPDMESTAGARAVTNFEALHPHNIAQKAAVILDHFEKITSKKMNGRAKAMVVTSSRLHAVRYVQELRRQIEAKKKNEIKVLVAFSGEVNDNGVSFTEEGLNKDKDGNTIRESALPGEFHKDEYAMLIVAEKYQTGFDEPLLHTMFVDKKLSGVKAVQTLSRLNRTCKGKTDTFILDFVNSPGEIRDAFQPYYEEATLEQGADPNLASDLKEALMQYQIIYQADYERFADLYFGLDLENKDALGKLQGLLQPAVDRFTALNDQEKRDEFKKLLARFIRFYGFITQVCRDFDKDLLKFNVYAKHLMQFLPKGMSTKEIVDDKILLKYYKLEKGFEGPIVLKAGEGQPFTPPTGETGGGKGKDLSKFSEIIARINERYGTEFTEMDKVLMQLKEDVMKDPRWKEAAATNTFETFAKIMAKPIQDAILDRYEQNQGFFDLIFSEQAAYDDIRDGLMEDVYLTYRQGTGRGNRP